MAKRVLAGGTFVIVALISASCGEELLVPDYSGLPAPDLSGGTNKPGDDMAENTALVSLENAGTELWASDKFKIKVAYLNQNKMLITPATISVKLVNDDGEELDADGLFDNFPTELSFVESKAESEEITVKSGSNRQNITILLEPAEGADIELLEPKYRTLLRQDLDVEAAPGDMDERSVYSRPDKEFRSTLYAANTGLEANMRPGNSHPNVSLAAAGWKFYTSHEFHRYNAQPNNVFPENPQPRGFEKYKNFHMQLNSTFTKESTTRVTGAGHLELWARRSVKNKIDDEDFLYFPMGRSDYLANNPNPDMYNNWEVGGIISDAPHVGTHWADFRPGMRIEIRMRLENQQEQYNPGNALWFMSNRYYTYDGQNGDLWPFLNWPNCGEIDLLETQNPKDNVVCSTMHSLESTSGHAKTTGYYLHQSDGVDYTKYNIYWMEWTTGQIKFGMNGKTYGTVNGGGSISIGRGPWNDQNLWAPFTDEAITGTMADWNYTWFTNPHGFRLILNLDMQKKDGGGNAAWSSGWNKVGANDVDNWLPSWVNETDPNKLPKMDVDWIRCYYDESKGFKGKVLCPGGAYPEINMAIDERPQAVNY